MADKKISALTAASTPLAGTEVLPIVQGGSTVKVAVSDLTAGRAVAMGSGSAIGNGSAYSTFTLNSSSAGGFDLNIQTAGVGRWVVSKTPTVDDFFIYRYSDAGSYAGNPLQISRSNGNVRLENNLVIGTSGNGIDFSANTGAAGMTSELLTWYEEGTWTPSDQSGAGLTFTGVTARYTRVGRQITCQAVLTYPATVSANAAKIGGLPFTQTDLGSGVSSYVSSGSQQFFRSQNSSTNIIPQNSTGNDTANATLSGVTLLFTYVYTV